MGLGGSHGVDTQANIEVRGEQGSLLSTGCLCFRLNSMHSVFLNSIMYTLHFKDNLL